MGLRMHFPFSFIAKRVDVSMGCQRCESHKLVMAAVAEMGPGQSLGHNYIKWWVNGMPIRVFFGPGLLAKEIRPRARRFRNPTHVMNCSYGVQLIAAVAAYSWLQLRRAVVGCSCGLLGFAVLRDRLGVCPSWFRVAEASGPRSTPYTTIQY